MAALGKFPRGTGAPAVPLIVLLAGIDASSITLGDVRFRLANGTPARASSVSCTPGGFREMTVCGRTVGFQIDGDDAEGVSGAVCNTLGDWNNMAAFAVYGRVDGITARSAAAGGVVHSGSLPLTGSAIWRGDMVGLDGDSRAVRGGAEIRVADLSDPLADVALTPRALDPRRWERLPIVGGEFSERLRPDDCIGGGFHGRDAGEAGGVFERGGVVCAFGAERP